MPTIDTRYIRQQGKEKPGNDWDASTTCQPLLIPQSTDPHAASRDDSSSLTDLTAPTHGECHRERVADAAASPPQQVPRVPSPSSASLPLAHGRLRGSGTERHPTFRLFSGRLLLSYEAQVVLPLSCVAVSTATRAATKEGVPVRPATAPSPMAVVVLALWRGQFDAAGFMHVLHATMQERRAFAPPGDVVTWRDVVDLMEASGEAGVDEAAGAMAYDLRILQCDPSVTESADWIFATPPLDTARERTLFLGTDVDVLFHYYDSPLLYVCAARRPAVGALPRPVTDTTPSDRVQPPSLFSTPAAPTKPQESRSWEQQQQHQRQAHHHHHHHHHPLAGEGGAGRGAEVVQERHPHPQPCARLPGSSAPLHVDQQRSGGPPPAHDEAHQPERQRPQQQPRGPWTDSSPVAPQTPRCLEAAFQRHGTPRIPSPHPFHPPERHHQHQPPCCPCRCHHSSSPARAVGVTDISRSRSRSPCRRGEGEWVAQALGCQLAEWRAEQKRLAATLAGKSAPLALDVLRAERRRWAALPVALWNGAWMLSLRECECELLLSAAGYAAARAGKGFCGVRDDFHVGGRVATMAEGCGTHERVGPVQTEGHTDSLPTLWASLQSMLRRCLRQCRSGAYHTLAVVAKIVRAAEMQESASLSRLHHPRGADEGRKRDSFPFALQRLLLSTMELRVLRHISLVEAATTSPKQSLRSAQLAHRRQVMECARRAAWRVHNTLKTFDARGPEWNPLAPSLLLAGLSILEVGRHLPTVGGEEEEDADTSARRASTDAALRCELVECALTAFAAWGRLTQDARWVPRCVQELLDLLLRRNTCGRRQGEDSDRAAGMWSDAELPARVEMLRWQMVQPLGSMRKSTALPHKARNEEEDSHVQEDDGDSKVLANAITAASHSSLSSPSVAACLGLDEQACPPCLGYCVQQLWSLAAVDQMYQRGVRQLSRLQAVMESNLDVMERESAG